VSFLLTASPRPVMLLEDLSPLRGGLDGVLSKTGKLLDVCTFRVAVTRKLVKVQGGAAAAVINLARLLGQMHGRCFGRCEEFTALRRSALLKVDCVFVSGLWLTRKRPKQHQTAAV
jgi:hypothetical protein